MMSLAEITDHADELQAHLNAVRRRIARGEYRGDPAANERLVTALEGRVSELRAQCETLRRQEAILAV